MPKQKMRFCEDCKVRRPLSCFSPHRGRFDGLRDECDDCLAKARAKKLARGASARRRPPEPKSIATDVFEAAAALQRTTGFAHSVDHIVPLVSPLVQSLNGENLQRPSRFIGPLLPLVQGLHVPANLAPMDAAKNGAKGNRWWPDMPDHPELVKAKSRFDARKHPRIWGGLPASRPKAGPRIFLPGEITIFRRNNPQK